LFWIVLDNGLKISLLFAPGALMTASANCNIVISRGANVHRQIGVAHHQAINPLDQIRVVTKLRVCVPFPKMVIGLFDGLANKRGQARSNSFHLSFFANTRW
jgi:hypothetical protein